MKSNLTKYDYRVGIVCLITVIVLGMSESVFAGPTLTQFIAGTTIKSAEVNANFSALVNNLPAVKIARQSPSGVPIYITSTTTPQNLFSITVTPPANGYVLLIANSNLAISRTAPAGNGAAIYLTNASQTTSTNEIYPYYTNPTGATGWMFLPFSITAVYPVTSGVASTFYMTGVRDSTGINSVGINNSFNDTSITAIFLPNLLP